MSPEDVTALSPGVYRLHWAAGSSMVASLAAVGIDAQGRHWFAPSNWITAVPAFDWSKVAAVEPVELAGQRAERLPADDFEAFLSRQFRRGECELLFGGATVKVEPLSNRTVLTSRQAIVLAEHVLRLAMWPEGDAPEERELAAIWDRWRATTPGEWVSERGAVYVPGQIGGESMFVVLASPQDRDGEANSWFTAKVHQDVPRLFAAIEERDGIIHDLQQESKAVEAGRQEERRRAGVAANRHLQAFCDALDELPAGEARERVLKRATELWNAVTEEAALPMLPPDRVRRENERLRHRDGMMFEALRQIDVGGMGAAEARRLAQETLLVLEEREG